MMDYMDTIMYAYASADETERLHLFLAHRDLRDQFIQIDMAGSSLVPEKSRPQPAIRWVDRFFQYCPGCIKS